jgi:hypothetical protein
MSMSKYSSKFNVDGDQTLKTPNQGEFDQDMILEEEDLSDM